MQLSEAIEALALDTELADRSPRTIAGYRAFLQYFLDFLGDKEMEDITAMDTDRYVLSLHQRTQRYTQHPMLAAQEGGLSRSSIAAYLRPVRRLFNWLIERE